MGDEKRKGGDDSFHASPPPAGRNTESRIPREIVGFLSISIAAAVILSTKRRERTIIVDRGGVTEEN